MNNPPNESKCPICNGRGYNSPSPCPACGGSGRTAGVTSALKDARPTGPYGSAEWHGQAPQSTNGKCATCNGAGGHMYSRMRHVTCSECGGSGQASQSNGKKLAHLERAIKTMEGQQMPVLIGGENWWPERYVKAERHRYAAEVLKGLSFSVVEPCEPDCDEVRHALHEGTWRAHLKIEEAISTQQAMKGEKS